jgi:hypothetical protein
LLQAILLAILVDIGKTVFARVPISDQDSLESVHAGMAWVGAGFGLAVGADFVGTVEGVDRQPSR